MKGIGLFVFGYPVLTFEGEDFFGDECYRQTIGYCVPPLKEIIVVARRRKIEQRRQGCSRLADASAKLGMELPDYGQGGMAGWLKAAKFIASKRLMRSLVVLAARADFIYADGPSFDAYLAAKAARRANKRIVIEMRGDVLLNHQYMTARFGLAGIGYSWLVRRTFDFVRRQAFAGLYINEYLMRRYPIQSSCNAAITDVHISPEIYFKPKTFVSPATNYLYVGHLEKVKRVDLILRALAEAIGNLPDNWNLNIVGDGPEEYSLRRLAKRLGIEHRICFRGRIRWGDSLFTVYKQAHLLLVTSMTESGPRVIIEAMASGLPVLSTPVGLAPHVLDKRMIVNSWEVSAWARAIYSIANDPGILTEMAQRNGDRSQDFDFKILDARRRSFYADAIKLAIQR